MPILRQISSGWVIRGQTNNHYWMFHVTQRGLDVLRQLGVERDGNSLDLRTFNQLRSHGCFYTLGTSVGGPPHAGEVVSRVQDGHGPPIIFRTTQSGAWELVIAVPALPPEVAVAAAPTNARLHVDGQTVHAAELWPDGHSQRDGKRVTVPPSEHPYKVFKVGSWPAAAEVWTGEIAGLDKVHGEIFAAEDDGGQRLLPDAPLRRGRHYVVLSWNANATPPQYMSPVSFGAHGLWTAWGVSIPHAPDERVAGWARHLTATGWRHRIESLPWRAQLASPVRRVTSDGSKIVTTNDHVLIQITPPPDAQPTSTPLKLCLLTAGRSSRSFDIPRMPPGPMLLDLGTLPRGEALLLALAADFEAFTLRVEEAAAATAEGETGPSALQLSVQIGEQVTKLDGLTGATATLQLPTPESKTPVSLTVLCPVPLDLSWRSGRESGLRRGLSAERMQAALAEQMVHAVQKRQSITFSLEAGSFGAVRLALTPPVRALATPLPAARQMTRDRWLGRLVQRAGSHTLAPTHEGIRAALPRRLIGYARVTAVGQRRNAVRLRQPANA